MPTPTYHVNVMKLKWEIICTGGLPHLSGLLHDWKETRRVKSTEANCVFRVFFAFHLFVFLFLLFTCLFYFLIYVVSLFTLDLFSQSCAYGACRSPPYWLYPSFKSMFTSFVKRIKVVLKLLLLRFLNCCSLSTMLRLIMP